MPQEKSNFFISQLNRTN